MARRIIAESRSDIVDHPYLQLMDEWELDSMNKKKRRTRMANVFDNWVGR